MNETASSPRPRRRARIGRMAAGAAVVAALVVGGAAPASADPERTMSIDPTDDVTSSPVATGSFTGASLLGLSVEQIVAIDLKVSPTGPTGGSPVTQDGCQVVTDGGCRGPQVTFSWEIPELAYNGPYVVEATGKFCDPLSLGCGNPASASVDPVPFRLGAEPKAPTDLRLEGADDRSVSVSWARNSEPDLLFYALFRKDPGGDFRRLGNDIKQPSSGRPSFTDTSAAATNGGDFVYKVFAVRKGITGDATTTTISKASAERTAFVAAPPTTTTPGDPGAPVTTIAGTGVDIGSFLSGQAPTLPTPGPIFLDLPDTGFGETLPFGMLPDEAEPGEEDAVLPTTPRQRQVAEFRRGRPLIPVAAGLILLVLAGHVRLLNVRTKAAPEKPAPGTYVARALEAARANQIPIDVGQVAAAVANGGHHRPPPLDVDVAALPVWAEFEPVSALGLLDAPEDDWSDSSDWSAAPVIDPPAVIPEAKPAVLLVVSTPVAAASAPAPADSAFSDTAPATSESAFSDSDSAIPESAVPDSAAPATAAPATAIELVTVRPARAGRSVTSSVPDSAIPTAEAPVPAAAMVEAAAPAAPAGRSGRPLRSARSAPATPAKTKTKTRSKAKAMAGTGTGPAPAAPAPTPAAAPVVPTLTDFLLAEPAHYELAIFDSRPAPEPFFPSEPEPEPDPAELYAFDGESEWSAAPEVFVSPRR